MTSMPTSEYLGRLAGALVTEIKSEMGKAHLSYRALAALLGENPQYVTFRIGAGNPRTGKRVDISVPDLFTFAAALRVDAEQLLARAIEAAGAPTYMQLPEPKADDLAARRDRRSAPRVQDEAALDRDKSPGVDD